MKFTQTLTRREFLKLTGLAFTGVALAPFTHALAQDYHYYGRVIPPSIEVHESPTFNSKTLGKHWHDAILSISLATTGPDQNAYNRTWFKLGDQGYVYSGYVQPVRIELNAPAAKIPNGGILGEVTVPYTDAHWNPGKRYQVAYRFYYQTTHWITGLSYDKEELPWYKIQDDLWEYHYYVPADHIRLLTEEEVTPLSPEVPLEEKRLEIDTENQLIVAIEGQQPVFAARIASGAVFSNGDYSTPKGSHIVFHKRPSRHMAAGNLASNGFDLPGVPWVCYFTERGVAIHGTYWHNDYGNPRSHGCINLTPTAAKWVFRWTQPEVPFTEQRVFKGPGTLVNVR